MRFRLISMGSVWTCLEIFHKPLEKRHKMLSSANIPWYSLLEEIIWKYFITQSEHGIQE